ncbi:universal stress protein [Pseudomonas sp. H9]|uniref:universal stress protein n=1 Tax=Pseudomonas sp. H9 TaxID=483968 RepID=UPI001057CA98|nr:universal stress protein [Pseudomonas sp. H9]TDF83986.1 universal stress protein [Pseudomonas sp. H9]
MPPLNHILVATDLSAPARHAAERAALLSKELNAKLDLLYVANSAPFERLKQIVAPNDDLLQRSVDAGKKHTHELATHLFDEYGAASGVQVMAGRVVTEITREVQDRRTDLLVCGAKGQSRVRHLLLGSTVQRMLSRMLCSTLVVKQPPRNEYRRVLVPVDFSASSLRTIELAKSVAPQADIILLHVFEAPFESSMRLANVDPDTLKHYRNVIKKDAVEQLAALSDTCDLPDAKQLVLQGDPAWKIVEQEQDLDCDLIVIGKQGESALEELLVGSITKYVLSESRCDVLVSL